MQMKNVLGALIFLFILASCSEKREIHWNQTGTWKIEKLTRIHYTNGLPDSTLTYTNAGYFIMTNNDNIHYSICHYKFTNCTSYAILAFSGSIPLNSTEDNCYWYTDEQTDRRLTLYEYNSLDNPQYTMFTKLGDTGDRETWSYVKLDGNGQIAIHEKYEVAKETW